MQWAISQGVSEATWEDDRALLRWLEGKQAALLSYLRDKRIKVRPPPAIVGFFETYDEYLHPSPVSGVGRTSG